jgi:hypothetical protein
VHPGSDIAAVAGATRRHTGLVHAHCLVSTAGHTTNIGAARVKRPVGLAARVALLRRYVHDREMARVERFVVAGMATGMAPAVKLGVISFAALNAVVLRGERTAFLAAVPDFFRVRLCGHRPLLQISDPSLQRLVAEIHNDSGTAIRPGSIRGHLVEP